MADDRRKPHQSASPRGGSEEWKSGYVQNKRGLNTKKHLAVDANGMPVRILIAEGTRADCREAVHCADCGNRYSSEVRARRWKEALKDLRARR